MPEIRLRSLTGPHRTLRPMLLLLVRHGLPERVDDAGGPADPGLAAAGRAQAEALASFLFAEHARAGPAADGTGSGHPFAVDAVCSSPMRRAAETAAPLAARLGLPVTFDDGLAEFDRHLHHYVPMEEIRGTDDPRWAELVAEWTSAETEEQRQAFRSTVVATVEGIVARHPSQGVAVVCHGGVINAYLSHVLGIEATLFFEPAYTSVSRVLASRRGDRQLVSANETPHLVAR
jgi:probable phosphoglycerate mutase